MVNRHWLAVLFQAHVNSLACEDGRQQQSKQQQWNFDSQRIQIEFTCLPVSAVFIENIIPKFHALAIRIVFCDNSIIRDVHVVEWIAFSSILRTELNGTDTWQRIPSKEMNKATNVMAKRRLLLYFSSEDLRKLRKVGIELRQHVNHASF